MKKAHFMDSFNSLQYLISESKLWVFIADKLLLSLVSKVAPIDAFHKSFMLFNFNYNFNNNPTNNYLKTMDRNYFLKKSLMIGLIHYIFSRKSTNKDKLEEL